MAVSFILEQTVESEKKQSEKWKRNEAKRLRASGEGKLPPEPSRLCSNSCRLKSNAIFLQMSAIAYIAHIMNLTLMPKM